MQGWYLRTTRPFKGFMVHIPCLEYSGRFYMAFSCPYDVGFGLVSGKLIACMGRLRVGKGLSLGQGGIS